MLNECYRQVLKNWFGEDESKRKFIDYVIKELEKEWGNKNVFIIEAPTGYGKSTISATVSLFSIKSDDDLKCIVAFPLRTLLEDQYCKFIGEHIERNSKISCKGNRSILGNFDQKQKLIGKRYMHNPDSSYLIKPITLTTVDTLALTLFGIPPESLEKVAKYWSRAIGGSLGHYLFSWASVIFSNIVLDEVHLLADSTKSLNFLIALMELSKKFDFKVILMSATIPCSLRKILEQRFSEEEMHYMEFSIDRDEEFYRERVNKKYDVFLEKVSENNKYGRIVEWIKESNDFRKVIVVFNTVNEAVEFYSKWLNDELREIFGDNILLLHSRFTEKDREEKIDKIKKLECKDKYIIISTQVIEAGVDITSNLFITDIAPASSLIQRLGRFLRREGEKCGRAIIWYEYDNICREREKGGTTKYKVYDYDLTKETLEKLKGCSENVNGKETILINFHIPETKDSDKKEGYKKLLNIYEREHFNIDKRAVDNFIRIFLHLENASLIAIEEFFKMEGSFIRESLQIPVAVEEDFEDSSSFVREKVVPISSEKFKSIRKIVKGVVTRKNGYIPVEKDSWLSSILKWDVKPQNLLKYMIVKEILAFIVDGEYDSEYGMRLGKNE